MSEAASSTANTGATTGVGPLEERATWLGYAGLLPFLMAAIAMWLTPYGISYDRGGKLLLWGLLYGATILSFLGGIRWGLAMLTDRKVSDYVTINQLTNSVIPALVGWAAVVPADLIPGIAPNYLARYGVMLIAFVLLMQADVRASADGFAPAWYGPLRRKITIFLTLIFVLIMMRLISFGW